MKNLNKMKIAGDMQFEIGQDKVSHFPSMDVKDDETLLNKLLAMKRSTFDKAKFTIVGSPVISDDGVASGFSSSKYIKTPITRQTGTPYIVTGKFNIPRNSINQCIFALQDSTVNTDGVLQIRIYEGNKLAFNGRTGSTLSQGGVTSTISFDKFDQDVLFKIIVTPTKITLFLDDVEATNVVATEFRTAFDTIFIGSGFGGYAPITIGQIDLKQFSITVDGKEVFNGNKTGIDTIKADNYEVVGSPVISDGVASGWSLSNYIKIPDVQLQNAKTWKIEGVVDVKNAQQDSPGCWLSAAQGNGLMLPIWSDSTYAKFQLYLSSSTSEWDIAQAESPNVLLSEGSTFKCELEFTGTQYVYTIYQVATGRKVAVLTADSSDKVYQSPTVLGIKRNTHPMTSDNTIDLNAFKIYVDGNLVYQPCLKIPYTQSKTGSKIVDGGYRDRVQDMYEQYGYTHYYTLGDEDYTLATCKGTDVVESSDNYEQTADLTLRQWGSATSGQTVNLLPYKDTNYAVTLANGSKTKSSFVANATGDYFAVGKTVLG